MLERNLEDIIYENRTTVHERGFHKMKQKAFRQVILPSGKKIDIFGFEITDGCLVCDIYELKRDIINADAVCQAFGYFKEIEHITKPYFRSISAKIIMVGKKYEPVSILDSLPIPIDVYTYIYKIDGIIFTKITDPYVYYSPHQNFSFGIWAFGYKGLYFTDEQTSISFHSVFNDYALRNEGYKKSIENTVSAWVEEITKYEEIEVDEDVEYLPQRVKTVIFPEPLGWTKEFADSIPPATHILEDFQIDDAEIEADFCDYEPDNDDEESEIDAEKYHNTTEVCPVWWVMVHTETYFKDI